MNCCVTDLRNKDVVCRADGKRIGNVCDVDVDTCTGRVVAIVIYGRNRFLGLFGHEEDIRIRWEDIEVIGDDTIIVCRRPCCNQNKKCNKFPFKKTF